MTTFTVNIETSNHAFCDDNGRTEVIRLLGALAGNLVYGQCDGVLRDINGNRVGEWKFASDDGDDDDGLDSSY